MQICPLLFYFIYSPLSPLVKRQSDSRMVFLAGEEEWMDGSLPCGPSIPESSGNLQEIKLHSKGDAFWDSSLPLARLQSPHL